MEVQGARVRILDVTSTFVSFKYERSNAMSRIMKDTFLKDYNSGVFNVTNPTMLDK